MAEPMSRSTCLDQREPHSRAGYAAAVLLGEKNINCSDEVEMSRPVHDNCLVLRSGALTFAGGR